jgi:hypothetical protein
MGKDYLAPLIALLLVPSSSCFSNESGDALGDSSSAKMASASEFLPLRIEDCDEHKAVLEVRRGSVQRSRPFWSIVNPVGTLYTDSQAVHGWEKQADRFLAQIDQYNESCGYSSGRLPRTWR